MPQPKDSDSGLDDLFAPPAQPEMKKEPAGDDPFGAPPAAEPAQPAAEPAPSNLDDLFNAPPAGDQPEMKKEPAADDPFAAPADATPAQPAPSDDPFGAPANPPATPPSDDPFGAPPATPPSDDPFGAPPANPAPANPPASDDPFGAPPAAEQPQADPNDPFGAATTEVPPAPASEVDLDDLFAPPEPAADQPAVEEAKEEAVDPFGASRQLPERLWTDNTGNFQVRGRLAVVLDGKVRILKETGRFTTVPFRRLSDEDQRYVEERLAEIRDNVTNFVVGR